MCALPIAPRKHGNALPLLGFPGHVPAWPYPRAPSFHRKCVMAFIPYVPQEAAQGLLRELYQRYGHQSGGMDNILRIHSLNPRSLRDHVQLYAHLMRGPSPLSRVQREMIAVAVSAANDCFY